MKWTYEKIAKTLETIQDMYIDGIFSFEEKEELEQKALEFSSWTFDEIMDECESRMQ